jgi:putative ATPase
MAGRRRKAHVSRGHDVPDAFSGQDYFPEALGRQTFYDPPERGFEREIRKRLDYWAKLRRERGGS